MITDRPAEIAGVYPGIYRIRLPLHEAKPDHINAYFLKGKTNTLFDTGMKQTLAQLKNALLSIGIRFSDIDRIIISHGHFDHYGAAAGIKAEAGKNIPVTGHLLELPFYKSGNGLGLMENELKALLDISGLPEKISGMVKETEILFRNYADKIIPDYPAKDGERIMAGDFKALIHHIPGHSEGALSLFLPDEGLLFSSDSLLSYLPHTDPYLDHLFGKNERYNQTDFYNSTERLVSLDPAITFPGHGDRIKDLPALVEGYKEEYRKKDDMILRSVSDGPVTIYKIIKQLFPKVLNRPKGFPVYIAVSEIFTHLQLLVRDKKVSLSSDSGPALFRKT